MFSNYKNVHKTPLATGRTKVPVGTMVPPKEFSAAEISSIKDWINKGYLAWQKEEVVDPVSEVVDQVDVVNDVDLVSDANLVCDVNLVDEVKPKSRSKKQK